MKDSIRPQMASACSHRSPPSPYLLSCSLSVFPDIKQSHWSIRHNQKENNMEHALNWREEWKEADEEQKPNENLPTKTCEKSKEFLLPQRN